MPHQTSTTRRIIDSRHPTFQDDIQDWKKWRLTYSGGRKFVDEYLKKFSERENNQDFIRRKDITPVPTFAKAALNDIRNSIFQRMRDIVRRGGSRAYQKAVSGESDGVDLHGSSMTKFLGDDVLTELLVMGKVGVYVDNPVIARPDGASPSLADVEGVQPYLYMYQIEDVLSWRCSKPEDKSEFQAILLRDTCEDYDQGTLLPLESFERFRLLWINEAGNVNLQFLNAEGNPITRDGQPTDNTPIQLNLTRIPFVLFDIGDSLLKDVCQYQIALLNLASSDVSYALKANFPFYTEQTDERAIGAHLKPEMNPDGTAEAGGQSADGRIVEIGPTQGRYYGLGMERPDFIHPSPEPLLASIKLEEKYESDIRKIMNLAIQGLAARQSAESKKMDNQGLESGLSFIGLVLEAGEKKVAQHWASYEDANEKRQQVAVVKYPDRYSLKSDEQRIEESKKLAELIRNTPSKLARKELWMSLATVMLSGKVNEDTLDQIFTEIKQADFTTSDPDVILPALEAGVVDEKTAAVALGFNEDVIKQARLDHAARIERIQKAQSSGKPDEGGSDPGARGVDDLSADPNAAKNERQDAQDTDVQPDRKSKTRGQDRGPRKSRSE